MITLLLIKYRSWQVVSSTNVSLSKYISWRIDTKHSLPNSHSKQVSVWSLEHRRLWWRPWQLLCLPKSFLSTSTSCPRDFDCREVLSNTVRLHNKIEFTFKFSSHVEDQLTHRSCPVLQTTSKTEQMKRHLASWIVRKTNGESRSLTNSITYSSANTEWSTPTPWLNSADVSINVFFLKKHCTWVRDHQGNPVDSSVSKYATEQCVVNAHQRQCHSTVNFLANPQFVAGSTWNSSSGTAGPSAFISRYRLEKLQIFESHLSRFHKSRPSAQIRVWHRDELTSLFQHFQIADFNSLRPVVWYLKGLSSALPLRGSLTQNIKKREMTSAI